MRPGEGSISIGRVRGGEWMRTVSRPTETVPTNLRAEIFLHAMMTRRGCVVFVARGISRSGRSSKVEGCFAASIESIPRKSIV